MQKLQQYQGRRLVVMFAGRGRSEGRMLYDSGLKRRNLFLKFNAELIVETPN
jgi:hypothetical protein